MNLKQLIKCKGYTQARIADKIGVSRVIISDWVRGVCVPKAKNITALAKVLKVSEATIIKFFVGE